MAHVGQESGARALYGGSAMTSARRVTVRLASLASLAAASIAVLVLACNDDATNDTSSGTDGGTSTTEPDGSSAAEPDAAEPSADSGSDAGSTTSENGSGEAGAECAFNRDCQADLRCECSEATGCACEPGVRGTGRNGLDACDSGDQCASSLCVEGPTAGESICSDACKTAKDCTGKLPQCTPVAGFPDPICTRTP